MTFYDVDYASKRVIYIYKQELTLAEGTLKVYGLPEGQGLDRRNDIILAVRALARGQSINLHRVRSYGFYCF